ncbi:MAG: ABC transporter ATP-binding protein [Solirubrobacteraceae bacterium]|nr:ABC transporter ATP-binding protein [Solirubrobacteraceae bacterium]
MARIELNGLSKRFGDVTAVERLDLVIEDGTFTALLGPSGCGKTTTMNMIAGLETPSEGELRFDGSDVTRLPAGERNVGFVFQSYAIFTHLSAFENIAFGLRIRDVPSDEIAEEVHNVARLLQLDGVLERSVKELSVNDLQKVAIGRSMVVKPDIFLLDEPFSNLDAAFRTYMRAELKRLQRELGQTMVYVTHDQVEAMSMAERIAIMSNGELQQYGSPDEVYNAPVNRFVAEFVGSLTMNFLPARIGAVDGRPAVLLAGASGAAIELPAVQMAGGPDGALTFGIRPEHVEVVDATTGRHDLRGEVRLIEPLGPRTVVHVGDGERELRVVVRPSDEPRIGDCVGVRFERSRIHLFDDATGRTLGGDHG